MPARAKVGAEYSFDAASDSRAITIPADCIVLELAVSTVSSGADQTGITVGGFAMTKLGTIVHSGGKPRVNIWRLILPPTGSRTIVVTNATGDKTGVVVSSWTAIDTTVPFDSFDTASATSTGPNGTGAVGVRLTVASAVGDRVADAIASLSTMAWAQGAGQTELWDYMPVDGRFAGSHEAGAAGNVEMTWTIGESKEWAGAAWNANAGASGLSGTLGQATETDLAQPITKRKAKAVGQVVETDVAQVVTRRKAEQLGQVAETDAAQAMTVFESLGLASEVDVAQPTTRRKTLALAQATEVDVAQPTTRRKTLALAQATETDEAQAMTERKLLLLGQAAEVDVAQPASSRKIRLLGQVSETDVANEISSPAAGSLGIASEVDAAQAFTSTRTRAIAQATEVDAAQAMTERKLLLLGQAAEVDVAQPASFHEILGQAAEVDAAQAFTSARTRAIAQAAEVDVAGAISDAKLKAIAQASELDVAQPVGSRKIRLLGQVSELDAAQALTSARTRAIAQAAEVDVAQPLAARVVLNPAVEIDVAQPLAIAGVVLATALALLRADRRRMRAFMEGNLIKVVAYALTPHTIASILSADDDLTVLDPTGFVTSDPVLVEEAGPLGGDLETTIASVAGNVFTLAAAAGKTIDRKRFGRRVNPSTALFRVERPTGAVDVVTHPHATIANLIAGKFVLTYTPPAGTQRHGLYTVRFEGTGVAECADEISFRLTPSGIV